MPQASAGGAPMAKVGHASPYMPSEKAGHAPPYVSWAAGAPLGGWHFY